LPVAKDLPRLARKIRVYDYTNEPINFIDEDIDTSKLVPSTPTSAETNIAGDSSFTGPVEVVEYRDDSLARTIFSILTSLGQELHDNTANMSGMTLQMFDRECICSDHKSINNFILRYFGSQGRVTRVLKACNQSIIAPPVTQLKKLLLDKIDYKDVRGEWTIHVHIETKIRGQGEDEEEDVYVVIVHRKKEQVLVKKKISYELVYQFEWEFTIRFRSNMTDIESISLCFKDILFNGERIFDDEEKKKIESMLRSVIVDLEITYDEAFFKRTAKKKH
jgi:hypothetical protein